MRAVALDFHTRSIEEREVAEPVRRREDEVLFRVLEVGICGTDRALARFELGRPPEKESHLVIGHEALGEVLAAGAGVKNLRRGDLVAPAIRRACRPSCRFCRKRRRDACISGNYTERGIIGAHGYFTDLAVDRKGDLIKAPPGLRSIGVLIEPLSVVEKAIRQALDAYGDRPRRALVLGAGPIGILAALVLLERRIPVVLHSLESPASRRVRIAASAGAGYTRGDPPEADIVIEAAGAAAAGFLAVRKLAPSGVAVILGAHNARGSFPFHDLIVGNRKIIGSVNAGPHAFEDAVSDLGRIGKSNLEALIERVPRGAFRKTLLSGSRKAPKIVHVLDA
ncbi:MAG: alcohol dehydrogenase catalytic domain-containing protein [Bryobacterales bacterium]|nr:alcohol dehydrogenase catalytic domain-containing protein [Bryobacterales bacterium]